MAKVSMDNHLIAWLADGTPVPESELRDASKHVGGDGVTNLRHLGLATYLVAGVETPKTIERLLDLYAVNRQGHRGEFEGLSVGYGHLQRVASLAVLRWAARHGSSTIDRLGVDAYRFLRWDLILAALCASDARPRVIQPCGRAVLKNPPPLGEWSGGGATSIETDYAVAVAAGIDWHKPPGTGRRYKMRVDPGDSPEIQGAQRAWGRLYYTIDRDVPGLFTAAERSALRTWILEGAVTPALRDLIAPIGCIQGLHVLRGSGGHVAWMEVLGGKLYGGKDNYTQALVGSLHGQDRFVVDKPPAEALRRASITWRTGGKSGIFDHEARPGSPEIEIVIDSTGGRVLGDQPSEPPGEPPPDRPPAGDGLDAEGRALLADLRRVRDSLTEAGVREHWMRPGASAQRRLMGETILEMMRRP